MRRTYPASTLRDIFQWDVRSWSRALDVWQDHLPDPPFSALAIGEREGGSSLWLALEGAQVECTDLRPFDASTAALHRKYGVQFNITYAQADATALSYPDARFDVVVFKSVIGALGTKEQQVLAIKEMHRVLVPGGRLLFAENLRGTSFHRWLRKRFVAWDSYWRYLHPKADLDLFSVFDRVEDRTTGFLSNLGRTEAQRDILARLDQLLVHLVPRNLRSIWYGAAIKGRS